MKFSILLAIFLTNSILLFAQETTITEKKPFRFLGVAQIGASYFQYGKYLPLARPNTTMFDVAAEARYKRVAAQMGLLNAQYYLGASYEHKLSKYINVGGQFKFVMQRKDYKRLFDNQQLVERMVNDYLISPFINFKTNDDSAIQIICTAGANVRLVQNATQWFITAGIAYDLTQIRLVKK